MKTRLCILLICLLNFVSAQHHKDKIKDSKFRGYEMNFRETSPDGRWFTFYKVYDANSDTLVVVNRENPKEQYSKVKVLNYRWSNNRIIFKYSDYTEVFDYLKNKHWRLPSCQSLGVVQNSNLLALYNSGKVSIYDLQKEKLTDSIQSVTKMFYTNERVLTQVEDGKEYELYELGSVTKSLVYCSQFPISSVIALRNGSCLIMQTKEGRAHDIVYHDGSSKKDFKISQYSLPAFTFATGYQRSDGSLIISLERSKPKRPDYEPEIWASSDNAFYEKYKNSETTEYLWNPLKEKLIPLGSPELNRVVDIDNKDYFLQFSFSEMQDYTTQEVPSKVYRYDINNNQYQYLDTLKGAANFSSKGQYIIYKKGEFWKLVNLNSSVSTLIQDHGFSGSYFTDTNKIIFDGTAGIWEYNIKTSKLRPSFNKEVGKYKILNHKSSLGFDSLLFELNFGSKTLQNNFIFEVFDRASLIKSIYKKAGDKFVKLISSSPSKLVFQKTDHSENHYLFAEEDYNLPKQFIDLSSSQQKKVLFSSNVNDPAKTKIRIQVIDYKNSDNIDLKGVLYYPLNYTPGKKYPMVVNVYQTQSDKKNKYALSLEHSTDIGFDIRTLIEKGYFVYLPDIVFNSKGTGISALDCVERSLDALKNHTAINFEKMALNGHSHGGYITNFIATHSKRFATYISGAGNVDLVRSYHSLNENFGSPFYWQFEGGQYEIFVPFVKNKELYYRNSPINYVEHISAPVLLWNGKKDINIESGQVVEFYIALKRNNKKATFLVYPNEAHAMSTADTAKDLHARVLQWLGHYLKGEEKGSWME